MLKLRIPFGVQLKTGDVMKITRSATTRGRAVLLSALAVVAVSAAAFAAVGPASASQPTTSTSSSTAAKSPAKPTKAAHKPVSLLRKELRLDIAQNIGFADKSQIVAAEMLQHPKLVAKLPAALQTDLKTLAAAPEAGRAADAQKLKTTAIAGGYGTHVKTLAGKISTSVAKHPGK